MMRLLALERSTYRLALLLSLVAMARLGWVFAQMSISWARSPVIQYSPVPTATAQPIIQQLPKNLSMQLASPESIQSAIAEAVGTASPSSSSSGHISKGGHHVIASYLTVQVGPPRSELRANGTLLGHTPFVGQISCEIGQNVKLDILPPVGMPKHYEVPCLGGQMHLTDDN